MANIQFNSSQPTLKMAKSNLVFYQRDFLIKQQFNLKTK
jgi:hypothetical protein